MDQKWEREWLQFQMKYPFFYEILEDYREEIQAKWGMFSSKEQGNFSFLAFLKKESIDLICSDLKNGNTFFFQRLLEKCKQNSSFEDIYTSFYQELKFYFKGRNIQEILAFLFYSLPELQEDFKTYHQTYCDGTLSHTELSNKVKNPYLRTMLFTYVNQNDNLIDDEQRQKYQLGLSRKELYDRIQQNDTEFMGQIIEANKELIYHVAYHYIDSGIVEHSISIDDLYQEGCIGFLEGMKRFDYRLGYHFNTYVVWWINQSILRYIQNHGKMIRVSVILQETIHKSEKIAGKYFTATGKQIPDDVLREKMGLSKTAFQNFQERRKEYYRLQTISHFETPISSEKDLCLQDVIPDQKRMEEDLEQKSLKENLDALLATLSEMEKTILIYHFGLYGKEKISQDAIALMLHVTKTRVQQSERKALVKLAMNPNTTELVEYLDDKETALKYQAILRSLNAVTYSGPELQEIHAYAEGKTKSQTKPLRSYFDEEEQTYLEDAIHSLSKSHQTRIVKRFSENVFEDQVLPCSTAIKKALIEYTIPLLHSMIQNIRENEEKAYQKAL